MLGDGKIGDEDAVNAAYRMALVPRADARRNWPTRSAFIKGKTGDARQTALADFCQVLFCLNEFCTRMTDASANVANRDHAHARIPRLFASPEAAYRSRREFLARAGGGFGMLALADLLRAEEPNAGRGPARAASAALRRRRRSASSGCS